MNAGRAGEPSGSTSLPGNLDPGVDRDLDGRQHHQIARRIVLGLMTLLVALALLNVFGQRSVTAADEGPRGSLSVRAPEHLRGGVIFEGRFEVTAESPIDEPTIILSPGWIEGITLNSLEPAPTDERTRDDGSLELTFPPVGAGRSFAVYTQWQVNPTTVGRRDTSAQLLDGDEPIAGVDRTTTIYP